MRELLRAVVMCIILNQLLSVSASDAAERNRSRRKPHGIPTRYSDINLSQMKMREIVRGRVVRTHNISGGRDTYSRHPITKKWVRARTPRGWFRIYKQQSGRIKVPRGVMYDPSWFMKGRKGNDLFAIHGAKHVPRPKKAGRGASSGCVRNSIRRNRQWKARNPVGTWLHLHD